METIEQYFDNSWTDGLPIVPPTEELIGRMLEASGRDHMEVLGIIPPRMGVATVEARLRTPLSETTWVIWRYDWPFAEGNHTFEVRCAEADGTPQIEEERGNRPSGATGLHRRKTRM